MAVTFREFTEGTTSTEMRRWHGEDRPTCSTINFRLGPAGYRCAQCGWICWAPDVKPNPRYL